MRCKINYIILALTIVILSIAIIFLVKNGNNFKYYNWKMVGLTGQSQSIQESKEIGAFICEIKPDRPIIIYNNQELLYQEGWIEKVWIYPELLKKVTFLDSNIDFPHYQLLLKFEKNQLKEYYKKWYLDMEYPKRGLGYGNFEQFLYSRIIDTIKLENIKVFIINSPYFPEKEKKDTTGYFLLKIKQ